MKNALAKYCNNEALMCQNASGCLRITPPRFVNSCKSIIYFYLFNIADRKSGDFNVFWYLKFKGFKGFQDLEAPVV